jgi:hypothetical protein
MTTPDNARTPTRTALLVTYHFPPSSAVGGTRIASFAKYLRDFDWEPVVLTIADDELEHADPSRLESLPSITIVKVGSWPTLTDIYLRAKRTFRGSAVHHEAGIDSSGVGPTSTRETASAKLRRYILSFLSLPDGQHGWIVPAAGRSLLEVRRRKVSCILTSCPPYSAHIVGLIVKVLTGTRWIADFRDPWMTGGRKALYMTSAMSLRIDRWLERLVIQRADVVVANTAKLCSSLRNGYPHLPETKFVTLTNSIDLSRFAELWRLPKHSVFTIAYAGAFYFNRSPEPVFRAVRQLLDEGTATPARIRIRFVGHCDKVGDLSTLELVNRYRLNDVVTVGPPIPYSDALELIRRSHVALLLAPTQPNQVPAKAYDYIGVGTNILAIAGPGATADLVSSTGLGSVYEETDVAGIARFLSDALQQDVPLSAEPAAAVRSFDARTQTQRLAGLFGEEPFVVRAGKAAVR